MHVADWTSGPGAGPGRPSASGRLRAGQAGQAVLKREQCRARPAGPGTGLAGRPAAVSTAFTASGESLPRSASRASSSAAAAGDSAGLCARSSRMA
jgi:hypothetical protein